MNAIFILVIILYLSTATILDIQLLPGDLVNLKLLEKLQSDKNWTNYIDELVSNIPSSNSLESMYNSLFITVGVARHWCSIPNSYIGAYQNASVNTPMIARDNVRDWLPCGVIILQYHRYPTTEVKTVYAIQVNQQFHINMSVVESELKNVWMDWTQPTYMSSRELSREEGIPFIHYLVHRVNILYILDFCIQINA